MAICFTYLTNIYQCVLHVSHTQCARRKLQCIEEQRPRPRAGRRSKRQQLRWGLNCLCPPLLLPLCWGLFLSHLTAVFSHYLSHLWQGSRVHLCSGQLHHPDSHRMAILPQRPCLCSRQKERDTGMSSLVCSSLSEKKKLKSLAFPEA